MASIYTMAGLSSALPKASMVERVGVARQVPVQRFVQRKKNEASEEKFKEAMLVVCNTVAYELKLFCEKLGFPQGFLVVDTVSARQLLSRVRSVSAMLEKLDALLVSAPELDDGVDLSFSVERFATFADYELFVTATYNEKNTMYRALRKKVLFEAALGQV